MMLREKIYGNAYKLLPPPKVGAAHNKSIEWTKFPNGYYYQGEVDAQGVPDGVGITIIPNESICFARYEKSLMNGPVTGFYYDGTKEVGYQINSQRDGAHTFT